MTSEQTGFVEELNSLELLELAAKAVGVQKTDSGLFPNPSKSGVSTSIWWNPLDCDGDAFQLAVTLGLRVDFPRIDTATVYSATFGSREVLSRVVGENRAKITRKAIVMAAARLAESAQGE